MNVIFLGPPGSGKGTISEVAEDILGLKHISTGDLFRSNIKRETELGKKVKNILASGSLVPDEITISMVKERLSEDDIKSGCVLDGFPRTIEQADALSSLLNVDAVINFVISEEEIIKRLSGRRFCPSSGRTYHILFNPPKVEGKDDETGEELMQREDDKEEAIQHRLDVYKKETEPLISYYKSRGMLYNLECTNSTEETKNRFLELMKSIKR